MSISVRPPTLPPNISAITTNLETPESSVVTPFERPDVLIALITSKMVSVIEKLSSVQIIIVAVIVAKMYITKIATDCFRVSTGIERLKTCGWVLFLAAATVNTNKTATVVTLIPPPVEPEP